MRFKKNTNTKLNQIKIKLNKKQEVKTISSKKPKSSKQKTR
ncbi:hypothetical protein [Helicobacter pylori]|nr:hypothetical protein [Helicobacter pylori]